MRYLLLIYANEAEYERLHAGIAAVTNEYWAFDDLLEQRGALVAGDALAPTAETATVRARGGRVEVVRAPVARVSEPILGYFVVDVADEAEALELAARIPDARVGAVEVRRVVEFERSA